MSKPKFYAYDPDTGDHTDVTEPVSTDGLNMRPTLYGYDSEGNHVATGTVSESPRSIERLQEIIDRGGNP